MSEELISVIIPAYNVDRWIGKCIESVINQTYRNLEIVIVNDGSTDMTFEICSEYAKQDSRIKLITQDNQGVVRARKAGISASNGEWTAFVDGDDWIEPCMYEEMSLHMDGCDLVTCGVTRETSNDVLKIGDEFSSGRYAGADLGYYWSHMIYDFDRNLPLPVKTWLVNKLYKTSILKEVINDCSIDDVTFAEDTVIVYSYLLRCKAIYVCNEYYYYYAYREGSAVNRINDRVLLDIAGVYKAMDIVIKKGDDSFGLRRQLEKWISIMLCQAPRGYMGFEEAVCPIQYILDTRIVEGKRVLLYGAGKCGKDYYRQIKQYGFELVSWVDTHSYDALFEGTKINSPSVITDLEYDIVLIAVSEERVAESIRADLQKMGIMSDKIIWKRPLTSF